MVSPLSTSTSRLTIPAVSLSVIFFKLGWFYKTSSLTARRRRRRRRWRLPLGRRWSVIVRWAPFLSRQMGRFCRRKTLPRCRLLGLLDVGCPLT
uniref:Uncharacterized protein n=1 Tax=Rhizophora mucronata TaxID=61149 RepID=A0A2P2PLC0_RHIMU